MCSTITILETWTKLSDFELYLLFTWEIQLIYIIHITFYHMSGCCMNNIHHTYNVVVDVLKYWNGRKISIQICLRTIK